MWHLWIVLLVFTTDCSFSDCTVYGNVNESPDDTGHASASRSLPTQPMDFVDTGTAGLGRERISDAGRKDLDLFSQLKHMQPIPRSGGHRSVPSTASESEMAGVRKSLATVLQLLLPYGRLQHRPHLSADDAIGSYEEEALFGEPLVPDGPDTANYMLHGKLVEIGPRQRTAFGSSTDGENRNAGTVDESFGTVGQKRAAALRSTMARRSHIMPTGTQSGGGGSAAEEGSFMPSISVGEFYGALTNLGDFFQNLKHNLESLESKNLNNDQVKLLEGQNMISNLRKGFFYSRVCRGLSQAGGQCRFPARHPELSALAPDSSAGFHRAGAVPWDQLSRSRVHACRTRKMSYPPTIRPPHSVLLASC
ncbi:uncharacterized protein LOC121594158 isoform X1 [Anopheles merus]|uniref:uncharacterized protein LOC121594158 isoform X1 n=1 Tax=Anopheles merus TaxID=30066 RepID=UPI001BE3E11E|nr:uncharacterized protein LOC121594158 isoform X1 [Anopheles merus]